LRVEIAGSLAVCRPSGALWLESEGALVAADLHLEKGSAYAARGQLLPPYDTGDTLGRLEAEVRILNPRQVILLGDSFHDREAGERLTAQDRARIARLAAVVGLIWVLGNHDADGPGELAGERAARVALGGLCLVHEPAPAPSPGEIAGHLHPCARVRGPAVSVRRRCFVTDGERIVLPAFGAYAGGLNVLEAAYKPLFPRPPLVVVLGAGRVHLVGRRSLRSD
jgi:DNA ligase-associated metallophosphoesterase